MSNRKLSGGQLFAEESSVPAGHPNNLEPRYSLRQAAARFFPDGPITLASLANHARKRSGNQIYVDVALAARPKASTTLRLAVSNLDYR